MNSKNPTEQYVAFLRGINVGGHHKIPMAELRNIMGEMGFSGVVTLLNSGNVIFDSPANSVEKLEKLISEKIENFFGFPVPVIVSEARTIFQLYHDTPFQDEKATDDIRFYISFLKKNTQTELKLPWTSADTSFKIIKQKEKTILSILDLGISKTPEAMKILEKYYGSDLTTRNWKTIERIVKKLKPNN